MRPGDLCKSAVRLAGVSAGPVASCPERSPLPRGEPAKDPVGLLALLERPRPALVEHGTTGAHLTRRLSYRALPFIGNNKRGG